MTNETATIANEVTTEETLIVRPRGKRRTVAVPAKVVRVKKTEGETTAFTKAKRARQMYAGAFVGSIGVVLTAISVSHLSAGISAVTHCATWESWAMAIGIDLGFVGFKACDVFGYTAGAKEANESYGHWAIIGTLILSALLNALTFSSEAVGYLAKGEAVMLGFAVPAMIFAAFKVASGNIVKK